MLAALKEPQTDLDTAIAKSAQVILFDPSAQAIPSALDTLQSIELTVAQETIMELNLIQKLHPEWHRLYEDTDLDSAPSDELLSLLKQAPNSFSKGLISGMLRIRLAVAEVTGRSF